MVATAVQHALDDRINPIRTNVEWGPLWHAEETAVEIGRVVGNEGTIPLLDESPLDPFRHMLPKPRGIGTEELAAMVKAHNMCWMVAADGGASVRCPPAWPAPSLIK
jgi:hypothetical protein